jgi:hypothetical protein
VIPTNQRESETRSVRCVLAHAASFT